MNGIEGGSKDGSVSLLRVLRPKQWIKNLLVFAAPAAAGVLHQPGIFTDAVIAFISFSLASSAVYIVNDIWDREADRKHPEKQRRPIASGAVSVPMAWALMVLVLGASLVIAALWIRQQFVIVILLYVLLITAYTVGLKAVAVVELAFVASGFVIRAVAGAVAVDVPISTWFLIVASFGSLFMVVGKRHAEYMSLEGERFSHRAALGLYTIPFLRYALATSSAVTILAYSLWAFETAEAVQSPFWLQLSVLPFVLALFRYQLMLELGMGGAPEEVIINSRWIQVLAVAWAIMFGLGIYLD